MKLSERQRRFTTDVSKLIRYAYRNEMELTFGHAYRDSETQARMIQLGLSKTKDSKHCDRLAVDFNLFMNDGYVVDKEAFRPLGEYWESLDPNNTWGGRFGVMEKDYAIEVGWDAGHFQRG